MCSLAVISCLVRYIANSVFELVPEAVPDKILNLSVLYKADSDPNKVDLGVGAYRDNDGKPWILSAVRKAEADVMSDPNFNHEYLGVGGIPELTSGAARIIFGKDCSAISENRIYSIQAVSGTGALTVGASFLAQFKPVPGAPVYISDPTWANHRSIFETAGHEVRSYPYCDYASLSLDIDGLLSCLRSAPAGSIV
ncbi:Aspartate aminotransferase, cytoplasmic, partial [Spiromyces aspiralis]